MQATEKELHTQLSLHNGLDGAGVTKVRHVTNMLIDTFIPAPEVGTLQLASGAVILVPVLVQKKEHAVVCSGNRTTVPFTLGLTSCFRD